MATENANPQLQQLSNLKPGNITLLTLSSIGISEATMVLAGMKLNGDIDSWAVVFIPLWWNRTIQILNSMYAIQNQAPIPAHQHGTAPTQTVVAGITMRKQKLQEIVKQLQLVILLALVVKKNEDATFIPDNFALLFLPIWIGTAVVSYIEYHYASDLDQRGVPNMQAGNKALSAVTGNWEFWQAFFIFLKVSDQSNLGWEATFLPVWFTVASMYMLVLFGGCGFCAYTNSLPASISDQAKRAGKRLLFLAIVIITAIALCFTFLLVRLSSYLQGEEKYEISEVFLPSIVCAIIFDTAILLCVAILWCNKDEIAAMLVQIVNSAGPEAAPGAPQVPVEDMLARPAPSRLQKVSSTYFKRILSDNDIATFDDVKVEMDNNMPSTAGSSSGEKDTTMCYICFEKKHDAVFMPCGHGGICYECGINSWKSLKDQKCPQCRAPIETVVKIGEAHLENGMVVVDVQKDTHANM